MGARAKDAPRKDNGARSGYCRSRGFWSRAPRESPSAIKGPSGRARAPFKLDLRGEINACGEKAERAVRVSFGFSN